MSNTVTFLEKNNWIEITTKREYLETLVDSNGTRINPNDLTIEDHVVKYNMGKFLHNPQGPAVRYLEALPKQVIEKLNSVPETENCLAYWVDGKILTGDERAKFIYDLQYTDKFKTLLSE